MYSYIHFYLYSLHNQQIKLYFFYASFLIFILFTIILNLILNLSPVATAKGYYNKFIVLEISITKIIVNALYHLAIMNLICYQDHYLIFKIIDSDWFIEYYVFIYQYIINNDQFYRVFISALMNNNIFYCILYN